MEASVEEEGHLLLWPPAVGGCSGLEGEEQGKKYQLSGKCEDKILTPQVM